MATEIKQTVTGITGTWAPDFKLNWRGYWIYGTSQPGKWAIGGPDGHKFGNHLDSYEEASAKIDSYVEADELDASSEWYVGSDWRSDVRCSEGTLAEDGSGDLVFTNTDELGSAMAAARRYYDQLCREPGACGTCYIGRMGADGEQGDATDMTDRDPQDEEEDRQRAHEDWLEQNHDALVWQDRYDAWKAEC